MKLFLKKMTAVLCAVCILLTVCLPVSVAADSNANDPIVHIHGFMCGDVYENIGTENERLIWPPTADTILDTVKSSLPDLAKYIALGQWDKAGDLLADKGNEIMSPVWNNPDGTVTSTTGLKTKSDTNISRTDDNDFRYDWRKDPVLIAGELNEYINYVLAKSGSKQVALTCHSMGGIIVLSYLRLYGSDKVSGVVFDTTAIYGETYNEELFKNYLNIDAEALYDFLRYAVYGTEYQDALYMLFDVLFVGGLFETAEDVCAVILDLWEEKIAKECLIPLFARWPGIWAMIPDDSIDACMEYVFDFVLKDSEEDYSDLIASIEYYNDTIRDGKTEFLQELEKEKRIGVISRYGFCSIPLTPSWKSLSDGVIDTKYSSFGATTASYGKTLSDTYLSMHDSKYISPDKTVDAGTCLFPDKTWFIRNMPHSWDTELDGLYRAILSDETEVTINTYKEYPQFLVYDKENDCTVPDTAYEQENESFVISYTRLLHALRDWFRTLLNAFKEKIFGIGMLTYDDIKA